MTLEASLYSWKWLLRNGCCTTHPTGSTCAENKKAKRQKQCRLKSPLMAKACEYSKMCDVDVCLGIRLCETGQVYIFFGRCLVFWALLGFQLVRHQCYLMESPLMPPEFILSHPEAINGSRSSILVFVQTPHCSCTVAKYT